MKKFKVLFLLGLLFVTTPVITNASEINERMEVPETCSTKTSIVSKQRLSDSYSSWVTGVTIHKGSTGKATISNSNTSSSSRSYTTQITAGTKWATNSQISASIGKTLGESITKSASYSDVGSKTKTTDLQYRKQFVNYKLKQKRVHTCSGPGYNHSDTSYSYINTRYLKNLEYRTYRH